MFTPIQNAPFVPFFRERSASARLPGEEAEEPVHPIDPTFEELAGPHFTNVTSRTHQGSPFDEINPPVEETYSIKTTHQFVGEISRLISDYVMDKEDPNHTFLLWENQSVFSDLFREKINAESFIKPIVDARFINFFPDCIYKSFYNNDVFQKKRQSPQLNLRLFYPILVEIAESPKLRDLTSLVVEWLKSSCKCISILRDDGSYPNLGLLPFVAFNGREITHQINLTRRFHILKKNMFNSCRLEEYSPLRDFVNKLIGIYQLRYDLINFQMSWPNCWGNPLYMLAIRGLLVDRKGKQYRIEELQKGPVFTEESCFLDKQYVRINHIVAGSFFSFTKAQQFARAFVFGIDQLASELLLEGIQKFILQHPNKLNDKVRKIYLILGGSTAKVSTDSIESLFDLNEIDERIPTTICVPPPFNLNPVQHLFELELHHRQVRVRGMVRKVFNAIDKGKNKEFVEERVEVFVNKWIIESTFLSKCKPTDQQFHLTKNSFAFSESLICVS